MKVETSWCKSRISIRDWSQKLELKTLTHILFLIAFGFSVFAPTPVPALCEIESGTTDAVCSGEVDSSISYSDGSVDNLIVEALTATLSSDVGIELKNEDEDEKTNYIVKLGSSDGSDEFGVTATDVLFLVESEGVGGSNGKNKTGTGKNGDDGEDAGSVEVTLYTFPMESSGTGMSLAALAGDGGTGGNGNSDGTDEAKGGKAGDGGDTGQVGVLSLTNSSAFSVNGEGYGVYLSAVGGDGGDGGNATSSLGKAKGRGGGDGGSATSVIFSNTNTVSDGSSFSISTTGENNHGFAVESIGGEGGDGGYGIGFTDGVGGDGGDGGSGGEVSVSLQNATISTSGETAIGLLVRSYGGAGGEGGDAYGASEESGDAGEGGAGAKVVVQFTGTIKTSGVSADAVLIQSVGGFAGDAGSNTDGTFVAYGGDGGSGGDGGTVTASFLDGTTIITDNEDSAGIEIISVGGGGGSGDGASGIFTSIGGNGKDGGDGNTVSLTLEGTSISTSRRVSDGAFAASIGGGGGKAYSTSGVIEAIGGDGGGGGAGGNVEVILSDGNNVETAAGGSAGIYAQSIGGGGGDGRSAVSISIETTTAIGGSGGDGGSAGEVTVVDGGIGDYTVKTQGNRSVGIKAQSVGGGGGSGGYNIAISAGVGLDHNMGMSGGGGSGASSGTVTVDVGGDITTSGDVSPGILAQSVGGGGGHAGWSVDYSASTGGDINLATGGSGGKAGDGSDVTVSSSSDITTEGDNSSAISAISVGGGGGSTGMVVAGTAVSLGTIAITHGQKSGKGGDSGAVEVTSTGTILTREEHSHGIYALSGAGGGGDTGWTSTIDGFSATGIDVDLGGSGSKGGDASTVTVNSSSDITVRGDGSVGIKAQSVGGDGGNAGIAVAGTVATDIDIEVAVGGDGGADGAAGDVFVTTTAGTISTFGTAGHGIFAHSVANTGGSAGVVFSGNAVSLGSLAVGLQGTAGDGGDAGNVTVDSASNINTTKNGAVGIFAQSVGAGGGSAHGEISTTGISSSSVFYGIGGDGGKGGAGGEVFVTSSGDIKTGGKRAVGIFAQSLGGSGGDAGYSVSGSLNGGSTSVDIGLTNGGDGGSGGTANKVTVANEGAIETTGFMAAGVLAQSLGGHGGTGGASYSAQADLAGTQGTVAISIGGSGGKSGKASEVLVENHDRISTFAGFSQPIFAQSVGGDGGYGGSAYAITVDIAFEGSIASDTTVGGSGGKSAVAGDVSVVNNGELKSAGYGSAGIYAQSTGGNGGKGATAGTILVDLTAVGSGGLSVASDVSVGGNGATGSDAGAVTVENYGAIETQGQGSRGIYAQSVGGGGGDGGLASSQSVVLLKEVGSSDQSTITLKSTVAVGGKGKTGGDGGPVMVINDARITTAGYASYGIFAQSTGGSGGNAGDGNLSAEAFIASNDDGEENEKIAGVISYESFNDEIADLISTITSIGQVIEITKSPDSVVKNWNISIGGQSGASGDGGEVIVQNSGDIKTELDDATAIFAQSTGGGGGSGGDGIGLAISQLNVGGLGSGGGDGGYVEVTHSGTIETNGEGAMGIFAQSSGGGGGAAGDIELGFSESYSDDSWGTGIAPQSDAGDGGDGGEIVINADGAITTTGNQAHGIFVQSVGGSGGSAGRNGDDGIFFFAGSVGDDGDGGAVTIETSAPITVSGEYSVGISAQSASGGNKKDVSGDVTITVGADIVSSNLGGRAIWAQSDSDSDDNNGTITVSIESGSTVSTSESGGDTIRLLDGADNTISNYGVLQKNEGESVNNYVVASVGGQALTIENGGTLRGSVSLSDADNVVSNQIDGVIELGMEFDMGSSNDSRFESEGTLSAGPLGEIRTSALTVGNVVMGGTYWVDLEMGSSSDAGSADLIQTNVNGSENSWQETIIRPNLIGTNLLTSGESGTVTIVSNGDSDTSISATELSVEDTATVEYTLTTSSDEITLSYTVDYTPSSADLTSNQQSLGSYIDGLVIAARSGSEETGSLLSTTAATAENDTDVAGSSEPAAAAPAEVAPEESETATASNQMSEGTRSEADAFVDNLADYLLRLDDADSLRLVYATLGPGEVFAPSDSSFFSSLRFSEELHGCPLRSDDQKVIWGQEGSCGWMDFHAGAVKRKADRDTVGYDETHFGGGAGGQLALGEGFLAGLAFWYEDVNLSNSTFSGDGYRINAGASLQKQFGNTTVYGTLSGGHASFDLDRRLFTPEGADVASSSPSTNWVAGHLGGRHHFGLTSDSGGAVQELYLQPSFDLGLDYQWQGSYTESRANGYGLVVDSFTNTAVTLNPMVEIGGDFEVFGIQANAGLSAGMLAVVAGRDRSTNVSFIGASQEGSSFMLSDTGNALFADVGAHLQAAVSNRVVLSLGFDTLQASGREDYEGSARLKILF